MPINDIFQKRNLLSKIGLGTPKMSLNIRNNQQGSPPSPPPSPSPKPQSPPPKPAQPAPKPGCGGCRRKRSV